MNSLALIAAALVLAAPGSRATVVTAPGEAHEAHARAMIGKFGPARPESEAMRQFRDSFRPETQRQVHIEQRMIIRITPSPPSVRREIFNPPPRAEAQVRYKEKKAGKCVAIDDISGISPMEPNRLLLFMRDHRMLSVSLERACDADAFYLGAYVERSADGKLCTGRDTLRARTGATCRVARISRLVAVRD
jgi:hypothetical protein